jgi:hypothetical protein
MRAFFVALAVVPAAACASLDPGRVSDGEVAPATAPRPLSEEAAVLPVPKRGAHVRVVFAATPNQPLRYQYGYLYRLTSDTLIMARGMVADTVLLTGDRTLEAVARSRNQGSVAAALGFVGGIVVGAVIGRAAWEPCVPSGGWLDCAFAPSEGQYAAGGAIVGSLLGTVAGFVIGSAIRTEEWGTVARATARVSFTPAGVGVHVAF